MSTLVVRIFYSLISVSISLVALNLLRKKGKVKRDTPALIGLLLGTYSIVKLLVYLAQGSLNRSNFLINILFFVAGAVILGIWGIKRKS